MMNFKALEEEKSILCGSNESFMLDSEKDAKEKRAFLKSKLKAVKIPFYEFLNKNFNIIPKLTILESKEIFEEMKPEEINAYVTEFSWEGIRKGYEKLKTDIVKEMKLYSLENQLYRKLEGIRSFVFSECVEIYEKNLEAAFGKRGYIEEEHMLSVFLQLMKRILEFLYY